MTISGPYDDKRLSGMFPAEAAELERRLQIAIGAALVGTLAFYGNVWSVPEAARGDLANYLVDRFSTLGRGFIFAVVATLCRNLFSGVHMDWLK